MVQVNWEMLRAVNVDEIGDDDMSGELFQQLSEADVEEENDVSKLRLLFQVAQAVMQAKSVQAEVALEELAKIADDHGANTQHKMVDSLSAQVTKLKSQLTDERERGGRGNEGEVTKLRQTIERLETEVREKDRQLSVERRENEQMTTRLEDIERERRESVREMSRLKDELEDCRQMTSRSGHLDDNDDQQHHNKLADDHRSALREKNRQIGELLDEVELFEQQNAQLQNQVAELRDKLSDATLQLDQAASDYIRLEGATRLAEEHVKQVQHENEQLRIHSLDLAEQHQSRIGADDEIIAAVSQRVEEWKALLVEKETTILRLRNETVHLNESLALRGGTASAPAIGLLTKAVDERDRNVADLKCQLERATHDLEESTACIEKLRNSRANEGASEWQSMQIKSLQCRLLDRETKEKEMEVRIRDAEEHAALKDAELADTLARLVLYERGEYGLEEAVCEIKEQKLQVQVRDKQIVELTRAVNQAELAVGELGDENDALYDKLGLERGLLDPGELRARVAAERNRERALNEVLQREVAGLEEERLQLKREVRKLAQILGHRASKYGLTADDATKLRAYADQLGMRGSDQVQVFSETARSSEQATQMQAMFHEVGQQVRQLQTELESTGKRVMVNSDLPGVVMTLSDEDKQLFNLLRIFQDTCPEENFAGQVRLLKRLLLSDINKVEVKLHGKGDPESDQIKNVCDIGGEQPLVLDSDISEPMAIDKDIPMQSNVTGVSSAEQKKNELSSLSTTADVMSQVNTRMIHYLHNLESSAVDPTVKLGGVDQVDSGDKSIQIVKSENEKLRAERMENEVRLEELERLAASLDAKHGEDQLRTELMNLSRQLTVTRVSECNLLRKCSLLLESESQLRQQYESSTCEILAMRGAVQHRIGYLERFKDMAIFKIAFLQRALQSSVPAIELDTCRRQLEDMAAIHRELVLSRVSDDGGPITRSSASQECDEQLMVELQATRERLYLLEDGLHKRMVASAGGNVEDKRVALMELSVTNEKHRADHILLQLDEQRSTVDRLKERNLQLEEKVAQLTKLGFEQQHAEVDLRAQLEGSVARAEHDVVRLRLEELLAQAALDREEISRFRELVDVAENQIGDVELRRAAAGMEVTVLRQNLLDLQTASDEKTIVGKVYRQLVGVQISEAALQHKLAKCQSQLDTIEALCLRLEQRCDEKDLLIHTATGQASITINNLRNKNRQLVLRIAGGHGHQDQLASTLLQLQTKRLHTEHELKEARELRFSADEKIKELEIRNGTLEEVILKVREGGGAEEIKMLDWHARLMELRVSEMKKSHLLEKLNFEMECNKEMTRKQEVMINSLEEKLARQETEYDQQVMSWESRERELEVALSLLEEQCHPSHLAGSVKLPVVDELCQTNTTPIQNVVSLPDHGQENWNLKKSLSESKERIVELERIVHACDQTIAQLQTQTTSATKLRHELLDEVALGKTMSDDILFWHTDRSARVAQSLVANMKERLSQKEQTVHKYEELLEQVRADMTEMSRKHQQEVESLRVQMLGQADDAVQALRHSTQEELERAQRMAQIPEQIAKMNELREVAMQQDNAISVLTDKLKSSSKEIRHWQLKVEASAKELEQEKENGRHELEAIVEKLEKEMQVLQGENTDRERELGEVRARLAEQAELLKAAPVPSMRQAIAHLRLEITKKEKQIQALSTSLLELKGTMADMAGETVKAKSESDSSPDHQLGTLQARLDSQVAEIRQLKAELRRRSGGGVTLSELQRNLDHQLVEADQLRREKGHLEEVIRELEAKVDRIRRTEEADVLEVTVLRDRVKVLEDRLGQAAPAERPYERQVAPIEQHKLDAFSAWDESKRLQQTIAKLRDKLSERDRDVSRLEANIMTYRGVIARLEKAKSVAEKKLKEAMQSGGDKGDGGIASDRSTTRVHDMHTKCFQLQQEVSSLKQKLFNEKDTIIQEIQIKNEFLSNKLNSVTQLWNSASITESPRKMSSVLAEEMQNLRSREDAHQKEILRLSQENSGLSFKVELIQTELPQYKERVVHLERYIDLLKSGTGIDKASLPSARSTSDSPRRTRTGNSGKTPVELESTISTLKKVVQRLQADNERLLKQTQDHGRIMNSVQEENQRLQTELRELETSVAPTPLPSVKQERGAAKIVAHNERLLHDLQAEVRANEALRLQLHASTADRERLEQSGTEMKRQLDELRAQYPNLSALGGRRWEAQVATRRLEERLSTAEAESKHRGEIVVQLRKMVVDAVALEETALRSGIIDPKKKKEQTIKVRFEQLLKAGLER